jgi:4-amino-4-deoxy-L-arabinose transferase-like glycosyltransferase
VPFQLEGKLPPQLPAYLVRAVVALAGLWAFWLVLSMAPQRIFNAGELEWMEGGVWGHVLRVADGKPIYVAPSVDFTPYIYTPFYYWLCAALGSVFGQSIALLRVVSLLSFVASCGLIVFFVWRKTKTYLPGIIGAGIFAATFRLGGAWFDIARGDSLLVALLLLSATLLFCFDSRRSAIAAGVVLALSFLTKQSAAIPLAGLVGWAVLTRERRLVWFAGVASGLVATS